MKQPILMLLLACCVLYSHAQVSGLKKGIYKSYDDFIDNDRDNETVPALVPFVRINKLDTKYNDTLYKTAGGERPFAIYDGALLYIKTDDSLYRKMDYVGRYPYVKISTKVHLEGRWVYVNKSPVWEEEHDAVQTIIAFVNRKGKWDATGFDSIRELLKGNHDLIVDYDKEKWNNDIFMRYLLKMNERYPIK